MQDTRSLPSSSSIPFSFHSTDQSTRPTYTAPENINTDNDFVFEKNSLKIAQLNCFNRQAVLEDLLANELFDILILQEPWVNPHTLRIPSHPAWHEFIAYDYMAKTYEEKTQTGIYVSKKIPSWTITMLPSGSPHITALEIAGYGERIPKLRILSVYNPPRHNTGLPILEDWFNRHSKRQIPTLIGMDANLHHTSWNPINYHHTHPLAKELIKMCGRAGFRIQSQKNIPTFYPRARGKPTTIDLTWINFELSKQEVVCKTTSNNYGSDHQMMLTEIKLTETREPREHNSASLEKLDKASYCDDLEYKLSGFPESLTSIREIDAAVDLITDAITQAFLKQGKTVKTNSHQHKAWWNEEKLRPLIKERNRARRWMILSGTYEAAQCYWEWNNHVKFSIHELKRAHWREFLAKTQGGLTFKAFKYTQSQGSNAVAPLYRRDRSLATDKNEQAELLFIGTSVVNNECDTSDCVDIDRQNTSWTHQPVSEHEVAEVLKQLPLGKAKGGDGVPNELLKIAESILVSLLTKLFENCLTLGYFPQAWRTATTAILRKHDKDDYSEPGAYRPIALLSCLGKVFETLITRRITHWAETNGVLAPGHMGGRRQHSTDDAFVIFTSWIYHKWREGKVVSGLFLDVKSAYPSVHKRRLADTLRKKKCPEYIVQQIETYLENRTTDLRLQDFLSEKFNVEDGLPQGSPLSVILYIIYNSTLLINLDVDVKSDKISLGFIDDITHLVANKDVDLNVMDLEEEGERALEWGRKHGAIFDKKKAQVMHFTHKKHANPHVLFGNQDLTPKTEELRWLGLWVDPKLGFGPHIQRMHQRGKATLAQLGRINRCYWGVNPKETKTLIMAVLKPRILFGSVVWFNTKTEGKVTKIFNLLQNSANRLALGAFKSSPADHMTHDANMISFKDSAIRYHHNFVCKRLTSPKTHPTRKILNIELFNTPQKLLSPIHRILRKADMMLPTNMNIETIQPYPEFPWVEPRWAIENKGEKRDVVKKRIPKQIADEKANGACIIFTDGSFIPEIGGGAAAAMEEGTTSQAYGPMKGISNYETEAMALILGLLKYRTIITDQPSKYASLAIFSDSQAALELLANPVQPKTLQYLAKMLRQAHRTIPTNKHIKLYWTPGHEGIELNEKADQAAREAAEDNAEAVSLPVSLGGMLRHTKETFKRGAVSIKRFKTKGRMIADALNQLEKGQAAAIFQLRCGHSPLRQFLHCIGAEEDDRCETCKVKETPTHFLIFCRRFTTQRQTFRKKLKEEKIKVNTNSAVKLLDTPKIFPYLAQFIEDTHRFIHLKTYLDK